MVFGVATWQGLLPSFTDGMCPRCAVRFRKQWKLPLPPAPAASFGLLRAAATLLVVTGVILAARPFDAPRATVTPPPETVLVPVPIEVQSPPAPVYVPRTPRRARPASPRVAVAAVIPAPAPVVIDAPAASVATPAPETVVAAMADPPVETVRAVIPRRRSPAGSTFAALPHAGLSEQTP